MLIFDLEQKILQFSNIIEDLEILSKDIPDPIVVQKLENIKKYYDFKFTDLWSVFEKHCENHHSIIRKKINETNNDDYFFNEGC